MKFQDLKQIIRSASMMDKMYQNMIKHVNIYKCLPDN